MNEIVKSLEYEKNKRIAFTYELGEIAEKRKAKTSLERAKKFVTKINEMINC